MMGPVRCSPGPIALMALIVCSVAGCTVVDGQRQSDSRYSLKHDSGPEDARFDVARVVEPVPHYEPPARAGNQSPYQVWGNTYHVLETASGYEATGTASWYGRKFHGHRTSNGEIYDMYRLTAAHRSLPLPSFLRVTNLRNGRSTIVRVNDRGPFHGDRLIDLSYAAARVLGFDDKGTTRVRIEAVATEPDIGAGDRKPQGRQRREAAMEGSRASEKGEKLFVQVGAFGNLASASRLRDQLFLIAGSGVHLVEAEGGADAIHRVWVGPFENRKEAEQEKGAIERNNLGQPIIISRPLDAAG